jgi:tetratricopeptide (TPR) repeat protein
LIELGQLDQAEELYRDALEGGVRVLGEEHLEVCAWKHNLAALLERKGELAAAEMLYREVYEQHARALGEQHENTRIVLQGLVRVAIGQRRFAQVQPWSAKLVELTQAALGPDDPATLDARHDLGFVLAHQGDVAAALPHVRECVERAARSPGIEPASLARYREAYGTCLQRLQRYGEAEPELLAALDALRDALGDGDPRVGSLRARLVELYLASGRPEQAARFAAQ